MAMMEEQEVKPKRKWYGSRFIWMTLGTFAYGVFLVWLLTFTPKCPDPAFSGKWWLLISDFVVQYLSCLDPNELGDFLAGAFAPGAFIMLAVAVLIQSQELRAQRKELQLTRQEQKLTREVLVKQAGEAKATAEFMGQQTQILSAGQKLQELEENDAEYWALLDGVTSEATRLHRLEIAYVVGGNQRTEKINLGSIFEPVKETANRFLLLPTDLPPVEEVSFFHRDHAAHNSLQHIRLLLLSAQDFKKPLSEKFGLKLGTMKIGDAFGNLSRIISWIIELEKNNPESR